MPRQSRGAYLKPDRKTGIWNIFWADGGSVRQRSTGTRDSGQAQVLLAEFIQGQQRQRRGGPRDPADYTIGEALTLYGTEHAPNTVDPARIGYAIAALAPYWAALPVAAITRETCRGYGRHRAKAPGTIRRELGTLRAAITYAKAEGRITYVPTVHLPAKPKGKERWLTRREAAALLAAARNGDASTRPYLPLFVLIGLYTGARHEAILSLRWPQVDLARRLIDFNEPGRERTSKGRPVLPIPRRLLGFLRLARKRGTDLGYVIHRDGRRVAKMKRSFRTACDRAGLGDVTPHVLRHTCGTWMAQAGVSLSEIAGWLGHTDAETTRLYAHHHPDYMKAALAAADRRTA